MRCVMPSTRANTEAVGAELLQLSALSVSFATPAGRVSAVRDLTLSVARGECLGVVGESGAGKSQAFLAVMGLLAANASVAGSARFEGSELLGLAPAALERVRGARIGLVFQDPMSSLTPHLTVGAQIAEVLMRHRGAARAAAHAGALALLERVHVNDPERRARQYPHELSGGMRQRVMIAIALAGEPQLLIADEPTTSLDVTIQAQILALLGELRRERGMALVLITHDVAAVAGMADRVVVMRAGRLVESGTAVEVLKHPREAYTRELLREAVSLESGEARPAHGQGAAAALPARTLLSVRGVSVRFAVGTGWLGPVSQLLAVRDVSLELGAEESLGIVGESGCGKSTLARAALALLATSSGSVLWADRDVASLAPRELRARRRDLQIVFQDPLSSLDPRMCVAELIAEPLRVHAPAMDEAARAAEVAAALARVGLPRELLGRYPHELSGGQCQRVGIARAMILQPQVLVCDEPVSALDLPTQAQIVALLGELRAGTRMSLLFISHNLALVRRLCARVLVLYLGRMMELLPAAHLGEGARHPYTRELMSAIPSADPHVQRARRTAVRSGEPPSALTPPSGCVYRTRCPHADLVCAERVPAWESVGAGHFVACHHWRELP
jgi:peptide/nickel transport system ATP-binding protein